MRHIKNSDNNGFTLLEVLIAVLILAVVIVPMLHSFVSSHRINGKSKQYMRATTLAQDQMEIFERSTIEELKNTTDPQLAYDKVDGPDENGCYVFIREGISNDSTGSSASKYDVSVTLDPERSTNASRYYDANTQALFYMNTMGRDDSAVYVQSIRNATNLKGYDDNIYEYFEANKSTVGSGSSWTADDFEKTLARRIKVRIYQENSGLNIATIVKVTYEYVLCQDGIMPTGYQMYSEDFVIFNNSAQNIDDDGNLPELKNVYLFYAPRYKGYHNSGGDSSKYALPAHIDYVVDGENNTYRTNEDWIVIDNEAKLPVNVYIVRQDTFLGNSLTQKENVPDEYQPKIEIHDGIDEGHTIGNYFTNLNLGTSTTTVVDGEIIYWGQPADFTALKDIDNPYGNYGSNDAAKSVIQPKPLNGEGSDQTEVKDRIYTMKVEVYAHGTMNTDKPLVTMTGSKLE